MRRALRARFWVESTAAVVGGLLALLTMIKHDWFELFGIEPDGGSGAAEWYLVVGLLAVAALCAALARWDRRAVRAEFPRLLEFRSARR